MRIKHRHYFIQQSKLSKLKQDIEKRKQKKAARKAKRTT